jgi:uncharacterized phage protein gp47/JayE
LDSLQTIRDRMLLTVPSDLDKSEGSFIWDAITAAAVEIQESLKKLEHEAKQTFAGTANEDNLDKRTEEMGTFRLVVSPAIGEVEFTGTAGTVIPTGTLVATDSGTQYQTDNEVTIDESGKVLAKITAVEGGESGNVPANVIKSLPVTVQGVNAVNNPEPTYGGEDREEDEVLRERYFENIKNRAIDGNTPQYQKWADEYPGIGRAKIFPLWAGPNTVKVSILDTSNGVAAQGLVDDFQTYLDPGSEGLGNGVAPIGSIVTVTTAEVVNFNISANAVLADGYTEPDGVDEALRAYFADLSFNKNTVSYMGIGATILSVNAVERISDLSVNGSTADVTLTAEQIPVLDSTNWNVVSS